MAGFSGIAIIIHRLLALPVGITTLVLNIPVALLCYKLIGRKFFARSIRCMVLCSIFTDYIAPLLPLYTGSRLIAAICTFSNTVIVWNSLLIWKHLPMPFSAM